MSRLAPPSPSTPARVRPGGRSAEVRERVARACIELLAAGTAGFGPTDVARASGVSRSTINRWWPTKADLLREALALHTAPLHVPDTGAWDDDVGALARLLATFFADPVEVGQNALMASGDHPDYDAAVLEQYRGLFAAWRERVAGARAEGDVRDDLDADVALLVLASPLVLVPLLFHRALTDREVDQIVALVLAGTATTDEGA